VQLTDAKGEEVESQMIMEATPVDFKDVNPGIYSLRVIFDTNKNGVYDTGSFLNKTQPERVSYASKPVEIRAAWDTFEEFVLEY
jgi:uncharacterized protein (DUF2141 family)